jgi:hypothetical protein
MDPFATNPVVEASVKRASSVPGRPCPLANIATSLEIQARTHSEWVMSSTHSQASPTTTHRHDAEVPRILPSCFSTYPGEGMSDGL